MIGTSSSEDFSYTAGQEYCVEVLIYRTDLGDYGHETYKINTDNTVTQTQPFTGNTTPSIPSAGTLRITNATSREVHRVKLIRMDW